MINTKRALIAFLLTAGIWASAHAQLGTTGAGKAVPGGAAPSYTGPGNVVSGATLFWGLRAYNGAYASSNGKLVNLIRASDSQTCDLLAATNGNTGVTANCSVSANGETLATFCASTTCSVVTAYDQTGNGNNATQSTSADQPTITLNCLNTSLPCITFSGTTWMQATLGTISQPLTMTAVYNQATPNNFGIAFGNDANNDAMLGGTSSSNQLNLWCTNSFGGTTMADAAWHVAGGVCNGASSSIVVDGTTTAWSGGGSTGLSSTVFFGSGDSLGASGHIFKGSIGEFGLWPSGFSSSQNTSMCHNDFTYWATSVSC